MSKRKNSRLNRFGLFLMLCFLTLPFLAMAEGERGEFAQVEEKVLEIMEEAKIPGLTLVVVKGDKTVFLKGFGYADLEKKEAVTGDTLFELASCSKAFTGLAARKLLSDGLINLDDPVTKYLPRLKVTYKGKEYPMTLRQILHQTNGIPTMSSSAKIPIADGPDALEKTVATLEGIELDFIPGTRFQYATINYDIIARVIEVVTKMPFEDYFRQMVLAPLELNNSEIGVDKENRPKNMAKGYKVSFSSPKEFDAPVFRGNNAAGYVLSNGKDMARWLKLQMGVYETPLAAEILETQKRDVTVPPSSFTHASYAMGWEVSLSGNGMIFHDGLNPSFSAHVAFHKASQTGVVVMANLGGITSNVSQAIRMIGGVALSKMFNTEFKGEYKYENGTDNAISVVSYILMGAMGGIVIFIVFLFWGLIKGTRGWENFDLKKILKIFATPILFIPFLYGAYLIPRAMADGTWTALRTWYPNGVMMVGYMILISIAMGFVAYVISVLFPHRNKYLRSAPMLILLSFLNGGANAVVIFLITSSLYSNIKLGYQLYYFGLAMVVYIFGRKVMQTKMVKITMDIVYELRMKLIRKIFYTSYQKFEKLHSGRVFATLNDDTGAVGGSANMFVGLSSSFITSIGCFIYLATIAFWATALTLGVIITIAALYYWVGRKAEVFMEDARDTRNVYMGLLNGLIEGFKELSLHVRKRQQYRGDVENSCDRFRSSSIIAAVKFINAFLVGESLLIMVLGAVCFAVPQFFPDISTITLMSFIMVLLYLIGPINGILNSIPGLLQLRIAWRRVQGFMKDIPANIDPQEIEALAEHKKTDIETLEAKGVMFKYESTEDEEGFAVGPIDFEAKKGEIIFIVGGNGSGKTTLANLLTGLYLPDEGTIRVNGKEISNYELGEYYSAVFAGFHLFQKLYNIDMDAKGEEAQEYLKLLHMDEKVSIKDGALSSINVSGGQRKRLALMQCYLEDCPIYLFDELAADQDPQFRKFFYRDLLMRMKERGKIVLAITHDDHYFDVADRVIKMDMGKIDHMSEDEYKKVTS